MARRLAAIIAADVVGYSRLMQADEAGTLDRLKFLRKELVQPKITSHGGRIVKLMGDGLLAEFPSVVEAVQSAIDIQHAVARHESDLPAERRITLRIGVNLGDIMVEGSDIYGDGVNVAARLESMAEPGGVCLSGKAYQEVRNKLAAAFEDLGEREVKNIEGPVRIYRWTDDNIHPMHGMPGSGGTLPLPDKPSIAVLPFMNISADTEQEYLVDGLVEEIITELSCFRSLFVIARNSSFVYKGRVVNVRDVGRQLGVRYVVEGSVRRVGQRLRIAVQLIQAESSSNVWADRFECGMDEVFEVQDEISQKIVTQLIGRLELAERERVFRRAAGSLSAYELLLKGKGVLGRGSREDILEARKLFEHAVELDDSYAQAYVQLAESYISESRSIWTTSPDVAAARAHELARKAVELDDCDSDAHLNLAWGYFRAKGNFELAQHEIEKAMSLNPNNYSSYCFKSWYLSCAGDFDGSIDCAHEAIRRNPFLPDGCLYSIGFADYLAGRYEQALSAFRKITYPWIEVPACIAACHAKLGHGDNARQAAREFVARTETELEINPLESSEAWRAFWLNLMPFRDESTLNHLLDGLRIAGLPQHE